MKLHKIKFHLWTTALCGLLVVSGCKPRAAAPAAPVAPVAPVAPAAPVAPVAPVAPAAPAAPAAPVAPVAPVAPIAIPPPERQEALFTFEDPAEVKAWTFNHPKLLASAQSDEWASGGKSSLKVTFHPTWPNWTAIMLKKPKADASQAGDPKVRQFFELLASGQYDFITFKLKNPNDRYLSMSVNGIPFQLPANSVTPVEISIGQLFEACGGSADKLTSFNLTAVPTEEPFSLYLDDFTFVKRAKEEPARTSQAVARAKAHGHTTGADRFVLGVESPMRHVFLEGHRYRPRFESVYQMKAARNESESFQLVVVPFQGDLSDITWKVKAPVNDAGQELPVSVRVVGYVYCDPVQYELNARGGWYPDLLVDAKSVKNVPLGQNLNLWVKVRVPKNAAPGAYEGSVTVEASGAKPQSVGVRMEVWPFALPTTPCLKQAYALQDDPTGNGHGFPKIYPKEKVGEMRTKFENMLVGEYRMDANNIYRVRPPKHWDAKRLRELADMGLTGICLGQFPANPVHYPGTNPDLNARIAEIKEYLKVVDMAGVRKLCYFYGFDEVQDEPSLKRLFETTATLKKHFPAIPFLTTATAYQNCRGALMPGAKSVDGWCPISGTFADPQGIKNTQQAIFNGRKIWWYVCNCSPPPEPNFDLEPSPTEPRLLMGSLSAKYHVQGFLYYALNYWGSNGLPADTAKLPYVEWNPNGISWPDRYNGQGILIAAGEDGPIPTIRMEMIRDGLEDYDLYAILRASGPEGRKRAEVPVTVVRHLRSHTMDPDVIEAERGRLTKEIMNTKKNQGGAK